jgi:FkbM family methyltransferase
MKSAIKRLLRKFGYDIRRHHEMSSETARFATMLAHHRINLVLDVGANVGQFAINLRTNFGYRGRIVSFEALQAPHAAVSKSSQKDPLWEVAPQAAIGALDGEIEINVSGNSVSSSILPMLDSHAQAAPDSRYRGVEKVPLRRLDTLAMQYIKEGSRIFLKVDTQGYERQVLEGAPAVMHKAVGVALEVSLTPLYQGDRLMPEMVQYMDGLGFELWGVSPAFVDQRTGRSLQLDAVFFRSQKLER